jgi:hypothetical protein
LIPKLIHVDISKFSHFYIYILQKEMFPNLTAREIGDKLKAINNGIKTEEELIQGVVEEICNADESTGDVLTALAKPKIQTQQQQHVHHAKNFMINSAKGKSLMKKVSE